MIALLQKMSGTQAGFPPPSGSCNMLQQRTKVKPRNQINDVVNMHLCGSTPSGKISCMCIVALAMPVRR